MFSNMDRQAYGVLEFAYREAQNLVEGGYYNCEPEQLLGCIKRLIQETRIIDRCDIKISDLSMENVIYNQIRIVIYTKRYEKLLSIISECNLSNCYTIENDEVIIYVNTVESLFKLMEYCLNSSDLAFLGMSNYMTAKNIILLINSSSTVTVDSVQHYIKDMSIRGFDIHLDDNTFHVF